MTDLRHRRQRVAVVAALSKNNPQQRQVSVGMECFSQLAMSFTWRVEPRARTCTGA